MACNVTGPRDSFETCCRLCDAGTYRSDFLATPSCQPCPAGFTCPPGNCESRGLQGCDKPVSLGRLQGDSAETGQCTGLGSHR